MVGIFGNENGIPPLLKWNFGHCKPKTASKSQLGGKNETRCACIMLYFTIISRAAVESGNPAHPFLGPTFCGLLKNATGKECKQCYGEIPECPKKILQKGLKKCTGNAGTIIWYFIRAAGQVDFAVEVFVFWLDFTMGSIRINPDRSHSEIKSKILNTETSIAKSRLIRCSDRPRDWTFLWQPRRGEAIAMQ